MMRRRSSYRTPCRQLLLALLCALPPGGCSALTTFGSPAMVAVRRPAVAGTDLVDLKGVVHCHGRLSHDSDGTLDEIAAACRDAHLDFLVMTDHQTDTSIRDGTRGMVGDTLFVVGAEVRSPRGTLLCFPLTQPLRRFQHPALLAREAAEQGGLAFVCHGELWRMPWDVDELAGAEIVNLHAGAMTVGKLGTLGTALFLPVRTLMRRICHRDPGVFAEFDRQLARRHPFTPIGGDDAHANVRVFGPLGGTIGTYREVFATLSTHVLATDRSEAALVDALRAGRSYVSFDIFGEGTGFDFRIEDEGGHVHVGGASVPAADGLVLRIATPGIGRIRLLRDGQEVATRLAETMTVRTLPPGVYRVEVETPDGSPWLFSSSIRVR